MVHSGIVKGGWVGVGWGEGGGGGREGLQVGLIIVLDIKTLQLTIS